MSKWIPENSVSYCIHANKGTSITIKFFSPRCLYKPHMKPISELEKDLAIADVCQQIKDKPLHSRIDVIGQNGNTGEHYEHRSKYHREIKPGVWVDVYQVCGAFMSAIQSSVFNKIRTPVDHAVKKLLAMGDRGHKDLRTDLLEAKESIEKAIEQLDEWI